MTTGQGFIAICLLVAVSFVYIAFATAIKDPDGGPHD